MNVQLVLFCKYLMRNLNRKGLHVFQYKSSHCFKTPENKESYFELMRVIMRNEVNNSLLKTFIHKKLHYL